MRTLYVTDLDARMRRTALLLNLGAVLTWSLAPSMIKAIVGSFPVNFQNGSRYLVSLLVLWPVLLLSTDGARRRDHLRVLRARAGRIVAIALANYAFQVCYTYSLFLVTPSVQTLVSQTQVLFAVLFALMFFPDERAFVKGAFFLVGLCLAIAGVALVIVGGASFGTPKFSIGALVVVGSAFSWALLSLLLRAWLPDVPTLFSLTAVFTIVTPLFIATYAIAHRGLPIPSAPALHWLILISSGLLAIGLGHFLFYRAIPVLGVSLSTSINLLIPLLASVVSYFVTGERLTVIQLAGAAVLIGGSYMVVRARFRPGGARRRSSPDRGAVSPR